MKKATMETIVNYINSNSVSELFEVRDELQSELNKSKEKAEANRALYESARELVLSQLSPTTPVTLAELAEAVEGKLPKGFSKGKMQYALTRYWDSYVVKHEGKVNSYTLKV